MREDVMRGDGGIFVWRWVALKSIVIFWWRPSQKTCPGQDCFATGDDALPIPDGLLWLKIKIELLLSGQAMLLGQSCWINLAQHCYIKTNLW